MQPWDIAYDLGPHDEHIQTHASFATARTPANPSSQGAQVLEVQRRLMQISASRLRMGLDAARARPHRRLFELGGMGSGDHHMALGMVGCAETSMPGRM